MQAVLAEHSEILGWIRVSCLGSYPATKPGIEMLRTGVRELVEHPRFSHVPILAPPPTLGVWLARGLKA